MLKLTQFLNMPITIVYLGNKEVTTGMSME